MNSSRKRSRREIDREVEKQVGRQEEERKRERGFGSDGMAVTVPYQWPQTVM